MIEKTASKWVSLATVSILGQPPRPPSTLVITLSLDSTALQNTCVALDALRPFELIGVINVDKARNRESLFF